MTSESISEVELALAKLRKPFWKINEPDWEKTTDPSLNPSMVKLSTLLDCELARSTLVKVKRPESAVMATTPGAHRSQYIFGAGFPKTNPFDHDP